VPAYYLNMQFSSLTCVKRVLVVLLVATCLLLIVRTYKHAPITCAKPRIYVGVFTDGGGDEKYANRRASLRATWFPNTTDARAQLECEYGMTIRFVVGRSVRTTDTRLQMAWQDEQETFDDFLKLDVVDTYPTMTSKTDSFFRHVMSLAQNFQYVVKVDDDMFVSPSHLAKAVEQWSGMKADYVGCMILGSVYKTKGECNAQSAGYGKCCFVTNNTSSTPYEHLAGHRWYEQYHEFLDSRFPLYAQGSIYALSMTALLQVFDGGQKMNRLFAVEDQAMGVWMLAHDVNLFDDQRLCAKACDASHAFVGLRYKNSENTSMPVFHGSNNCYKTPPATLPFLDSPISRFNVMIEAYTRASDSILVIRLFLVMVAMMIAAFKLGTCFVIKKNGVGK